MTRLVLIAALIAAVFASGASAMTLSGDVRPRHRNWIREAAQYVTLPNEHLWIVSDWDPEFIPESKEILLPQPGSGGWTYHDEHYLLLHELGHAFDFQYMTPASRAAFKVAIGSPCSWWSEHCPVPRWPGHSVPPGERFAELYAACALGLTRRQADEAGYPSYGWDPPEGKDDLSLCPMIIRYR